MGGAGVLLIYTGGTIGSLRRNRTDPLSPLEPAPLAEVLRLFPAYDPAGRRMVLGGGSVRVDTEAFDPPLDSSDMRPEHWLRLARLIRDRYDDYEGFVIAHGTDTLAYTASALAFILQNLDKPVILTGAQRPMGEVRTDATQNLITAVEIAAARSLGATVVPEVCVFFRDRLLRGCRTTKVHASSYDAFDSPNLSPLGWAGDRIRIDRDRIRAAGSAPLRLRERFEERVAVLDLFPGMPVGFLTRVVSLDGLRGVVLRTFGNGNVSSDPALLDTLCAAVDRGIVVVNATQCLAGEVTPGRYVPSAQLVARGVVGSMDMTREAALTKLGVILGEERDPAIAADRMLLDLAGEQRASVVRVRYPGGRSEPDPRAAEPVKPIIGAERLGGGVQEAVLRILGLSPVPRGGRVRFYLGRPDERADTVRGDPSRFLGEVHRRPGDSSAVVLGVTGAVREGLGADPPCLVWEGDGDPVVWDRAVLACTV